MKTEKIFANALNQVIEFGPIRLKTNQASITEALPTHGKLRLPKSKK